MWLTNPSWEEKRCLTMPSLSITQVTLLRITLLRKGPKILGTL
jgi:hypothetical protein